MKSPIKSVALAVSVFSCLAGCGPTPLRHDDLVPRDLVLPGFEQSECHFKNQWTEEPRDNGPASTFGGQMTNARSADSEHRVLPPVECHKTQVTAPPPTSSEHEDLCGDGNGELKFCERGS
jgi:hypothetical protein